ncbi:MAG: type II methionyl aminopeptidase [Candidatus Woesearchaeota archaeon]
MQKEHKAYFKKAGQIAAKARDYGASLIKEGEQVLPILDKVEDFILKQGAGIAFPAQISINTIAAHQCSAHDDKTIITSSDVVKLDVGAHVNGFIGDTARTINLDGSYKELIDASKAALDKAITLMKPNMPVGEIGQAIQETIQDKGFVVVKNLSGHGLGPFQIHTTPQIPNIALPKTLLLQEGMTVASEPFATNGAGAIAEGGEPTVFSAVPNARLRTRTLFVKDVFKKIQSYQGLPFASRWLVKEFGSGKVRFALKELERSGVIHSHPPLREIAKGMVAQSEHSFLIQKNKPLISTRIDDDF